MKKYFGAVSAAMLLVVGVVLASAQQTTMPAPPDVLVAQANAGSQLILYKAWVETQLGTLWAGWQSDMQRIGVLESKVAAQTTQINALQAQVKAIGLQPSATSVALLPSASANPGLLLRVTDSTPVTTEGQACVAVAAGTQGNLALAFSTGTSWKCF